MHRHSFPTLRSTSNFAADPSRRSLPTSPDTIPEWVINESMDDRVPCQRAGHSLASFEDKIYLFGGCCSYYPNAEDMHDSNEVAHNTGDLLHFNTLHEYSTETNKWRQLHSGGEGRLPSRLIPKERRHASLVVYGRSLYLYGGFDRGDHVLSDLWEFHLDQKQWLLVSRNPDLCNYNMREPLSVFSTVPIPVARAEHTAVVYKHLMVVFGGYDGKKKLSDTFVYDFVTRRWSSPFAARERAPSRRCKHSAVLYNGKMFIVGGFQYKGGENYALTDMHALDLESFTWENCRIDDSAPQALQGHKAVVCGDAMYILGGKVRPRNVRNSMPAPTLNQTSPVGIIPSNMDISVTHVNLASLMPRDSDGSIQIPSEYMPDETRSSGLSHVVFTYDFGTMRWSVLRTIGMPPTPRQLHAVVPVQTNDFRCSIFVFGGTDRSKQRYYNDLVELRGILSPTKYPDKCETCTSTRSLLNNEMFSDVKFVIEGKKIYAHKCILYARSEYFRGMFDSSMREASASDIPIPDVTYEVFYGVMNYLYAGEVRVRDGQVAVELLKAADMFRLEGLKNRCAEKLERGVTPLNAAFICQVADRHNSPNLKNYCIAYIVENFKHVIKTESFVDLMTQDAGGLGREILIAFSDSTSYDGLKRARK